MNLEIVSPEATLFNGEVTSVAVPGLNGEFEMLNNHAPVVSILKSGYVKIKGDIQLDQVNQGKFIKKDKCYWLEINSGTIEMKNNKVIVLAE
ncbi:F0F1 ATP synthase subunit epsilon [Paucihalobacter ruber]|uniref:F0F1 ATP synthase subunit epsilon n=1 Tax=Paucihalobacter ruber TaxID=2567861 RepID=A0A506PLY8_9FLAO|nr:F0F1 ATP synthase subunit epsilon [Paucihalobacter ruber]TPV34731.1 F0F1 ATP synthase subunit epsilon [Paucihalobacter ruber]